MIPGLDSANVPSAAQVAAAKSVGYRIWSGYLSTAPYDGGSHFGLWHPWPRSGFDACQALGSTPLAFCSGWDDPVALKALAASWGVLLCLDVESGIRGNGPWIPAWLDASGAGLYGNLPVHGYSAPFHVLAAYPGYNPQATWSGARPAGACAWQWQGTHTEFGIGVDSTWFDDAFAGLHGGGSGSLTGDDMSALSDKLILRLAAAEGFISRDTTDPVDGEAMAPYFDAGTAQRAKEDAILRAVTTGATGGTLTAVQAAELDAIAADAKATRDKITKDLA